nr:PsiF family protein [Parachitinimonas caeni]
MLFIALCLSASLAAAADDAAPNKQQNKMAQCNQEAGDKKGPERKQFMSDCLKNKQKAQQEKMKACNKDAEGKKGAERKEFMATCLKKDS